MNKETKFKVGDRAHKTKGYKFPCTIVGVFETIKGDIRVVGEMDEYGLLHIFNEDQLEHVEQKVMNKELIIDEVYENYHQENKHVKYLTFLLKEEFINKCKTDPKFSEKWGLKIEERELSLDERVDLMRKRTIDGTVDYDNRHHYFLDTHNIPTKLITITYNNETIESYE
jgi:hypothetical protein